ncbi:MAG: prepilin peptidase [Planctomycetota bacterium]|nr:prepilin peptidase [Planctomycetota bacterium]
MSLAALPPDFMHTFWVGVAGATGLVVGSFLNVVIWRLPRGLNLAHPPSACPGCGKGIRWFDNIPVISYVLLLRGRCRGCKMRISPRYPLVEALTGALFVLAALNFMPHAVSVVVVCLATAALVAISFIDLDLRIIPDKISKPGIVFGIATAPFTVLFARRQPDGWYLPDTPWLDALAFMAAGAVVGAGVIYAVRWLGTAILKKEAMGLGDAKLLAFLGAFVGPLHALYTLVLGSMGGAVLGGLWFMIGKRRHMQAEVVVTAPKAGLEAPFDRVRIREQTVELRGGPAAEAGERVHLTMQLPAARILEDEDAEVRVKGRLTAVARSGDAFDWTIELDDCKGGKAAELAYDRIAMFSISYKYIPFGPFLALGGLALILYGEQIEWFIKVGYPTWMQGVMGG